MSDYVDPLIQPMDLAAVLRLTKDLRASARLLAPKEARFLVDEYYSRQEDRIRSSNQSKALEKANEPNLLVTWLSEQNEVLEKQIASVLDRYSLSQPVGEWMRSITGIGPVIAAGILAHIDIEQCPTAGHLWSFAGLVSTITWQKETKRPWNAKLKTLCWKLGESFVKVSNLEHDVYGKIYAARKVLENQRNIKGDYITTAAEQLIKRKYSKDTDAYLWYTGALAPNAIAVLAVTAAAARPAMLKRLVAEAAKKGTGQPMLPPAHIHARAKRYAVKLFLSHLHEVWYTLHFGVAPAPPYAIAVLKHAHYIPPPNFQK